MLGLGKWYTSIYSVALRQGNLRIRRSNTRIQIILSVRVKWIAIILSMTSCKFAIFSIPLRVCRAHKFSIRVTKILDRVDRIFYYMLWQDEKLMTLYLLALIQGNENEFSFFFYGNVVDIHRELCFFHFYKVKHLFNFTHNCTQYSRSVGREKPAYTFLLSALHTPSPTRLGVFRVKSNWRLCPFWANPLYELNLRPCTYCRNCQFSRLILQCICRDNNWVIFIQTYYVTEFCLNNNVLRWLSIYIGGLTHCQSGVDIPKLLFGITSVVIVRGLFNYFFFLFSIPLIVFSTFFQFSLHFKIIFTIFSLVILCFR